MREFLYYSFYAGILQKRILFVDLKNFQGVFMQEYLDINRIIKFHSLSTHTNTHTLLLFH